MSRPDLDEMTAVRAGVEGDPQRRYLYRQLARYATRRRRLAPDQSTPWLDRKLDQLLDKLLVLRGRP